MAAGAKIAEPQPDDGGLPRAHIQLIMGRGFGSCVRGIDRVAVSVHHVVVDPIFDVGTGVVLAKEPLVVGLIFREQ